MPSLPLIVFDLDGTLVDSRRDLADAANEMLGAYDALPLTEEVVGAMVGDGAARLVSRLLAARSLDVPHAEALAQYLEMYGRRLLDHTRAYPGIPEALDVLSATGRLAVLTNKPTRATEEILDGLDLRRRFAWVIGGDSPLGRKPDPRGIEWLLGTAATDRNGAVLVGDSAADVLTARNAGIRICLARYGFGFANMPDGVLDGSELAVDAAWELPDRLTTLPRPAP